jgi:gamma-glutamyltranspeptidase
VTRYRGPIGEDIVTDLERRGGLLDARDFAITIQIGSSR